jgi:hypothetical protein
VQARTRGGRWVEWALAVGLPLVPVAILAVDAARVTGFGADAAVSYAQAARHLDELSFPVRGLMNSHAFWNPNGLVLLVALLLALARGPLAFSVLLAVVQAAAVLACYRWLTAEESGRRSWILYLVGLPLLVWTPVLSHTAVDLWAQYVARTLLCVLFALAVSTGSIRSARRDAAFGFLLLFAPAVHLGLLQALPVALLPLLLPWRRDRVRWRPFAAGAAAAFALCWVPWVVSGAAASIADGLHPKLDPGWYWSAVLGPVFELPGLLTSPHEGWFDPARVKILTATTDARLQAFADVRCAVGLAVLLAAALLLLARRRAGRTAVEVLAYVVLLVYLWEANGASLERRPDFGTMVLQPLYLGIAVAAYRMLLALADGLRASGRKVPIALLHAGVVVMVASMATLWASGVFAITRDVRENDVFGSVDIPLEEKLAALAALDRAASGRATASVVYHNESFHPTFPYVAAYGRREVPSPRDYRPGSFFEAVLNGRSRTRYAFVDPSEPGDFALTHPPDSRWAEDRGCRSVWRGRRLGVWQCAAEYAGSGSP